MPFSILGLNHNTAPVEIREQVVFEGDAVNRAISAGHLRLTHTVSNYFTSTEFYFFSISGAVRLYFYP